MRISDWSSDVCSSDLLCEAEHVGAVDDQRVGGWNVDSGFDDGGRKQHLIFPVVEGRHAVFHLGRRYLVMGDDVANIRHRIAQKLLDFRNFGVVRGDEADMSAQVMRSDEHTYELQSLIGISYTV